MNEKQEIFDEKWLELQSRLITTSDIYWSDQNKRKSTLKPEKTSTSKLWKHKISKKYYANPIPNLRYTIWKKARCKHSAGEANRATPNLQSHIGWRLIAENGVVRDERLE